MMGNHRYRNGFEVTRHEDALNPPKAWKSPKVIFVNSMSDLFHRDNPVGVYSKSVQNHVGMPYLSDSDQ